MNVYESTLGCCNKAADASPRLAVVRGVADSSDAPDDAAHWFLKIDGHRAGRDFKLYAFMARMASPGVALADFAEVFMVVKCEVPGAFEAVRDDVVGWSSAYGDTEMQKAWADLWL